MEDAATAEISRAQVWQWIRHRAKLADGRTVDLALCRRCSTRSWRAFRKRARPLCGRGELFSRLIEDDDFAEFLTLPAYDMMLAGAA